MNDTLEHHGILGMKWGVRRYQNKDGTWTEEGKEHRQSDGDTEANSARYSKYSVHSRDPQYRDKVDPVLYNNITTNHPEEVEQYAEVNKEYYDYVKEKTPEIIVDYINSIYGGKATAENFDDELQNDWDHSDIEAYLGSNANDSHYKELKEKWLSSLKEMYKLISDETDKYLGDNSDAKEYDMSSKIEDQILKDRNGKTQWEMAVEINDLMNEAMYNEYKRLSGEDDETKHSDDSSEDILEHHGILGMKWGIRRYQNADGSLTAAGRKRYGVDENDGQRSSSGQSSGSNFDATPRTPARSASEMTDQELNQALNRLRMEQQYNELTGAKSSNQYQNQQNFSTPPSNTGNLSNAELQAYITRLDMEKRYAQLTAPPPKEVSAGRKFINDVVGPAVNQVAKAFIVASLSKALGLKGDGDNGGNNNNNGGKKNNNNDDSQYKAIKKELNDLKSMMGSQRKQDNGGNQKKESKREETPEAANFLPEPGKTSYKEHRSSIIDAARAAADAAREKKRQRDSLSDRLSGYRSDRERARQREQDRAERERQREEDRRKAALNPNSSDYYRSMWTYGM